MRPHRVLEVLDRHRLKAIQDAKKKCLQRFMNGTPEGTRLTSNTPEKLVTRGPSIYLKYFFFSFRSRFIFTLILRQYICKTVRMVFMNFIASLRVSSFSFYLSFIRVASSCFCIFIFVFSLLVEANSISRHIVRFKH